MKKLLQLEMQKNNFRQIVIGGALASGVLLIYLIFFALLTNQDCPDYISFFDDVLAFNKIVFTLFAGFLIIKMFSDEINSKSISILFTYPLDRKHLLVVKVVLILMITTPLMFCSMLVHFIVLTIVNALFGFIQGSLSMSFVITYILAGLVHSILASLAALIPIFIDVKFASSQMTLITSAVMAVFLYSFPGNSLFGAGVIFGVIAAVAGVVLARLAIDIASEMDIM